jgi:hypothetical protein
LIKAHFDCLLRKELRLMVINKLLFSLVKVDELFELVYTTLVVFFVNAMFC